MTMTTETRNDELIGLLTGSILPILKHTTTFAAAAAADPSTPDVTPAATAATVALPKAEEFYLRPNGEKYIPRKMTVEGKVTADVVVIREAIAANMPVLLYGEPGCGKTALVEAAFGEDLVTVQGTVETETADFVGSWTQQTDGTYLWVDGPLAVAAEEGRKLFIDEIALIDPRVMAVVYGLMDGRDELVVTANPARGVIKKKEGFAVVGACNPNVPGAMMSEALISRFTMHFEMPTDWGIASKLGVPPKITQVVRNLNHKLSKGEVTQAPQLRELIAFRDVAAKFGEQVALANFLGQIREENRHLASAEIETVFSTKTHALRF